MDSEELSLFFKVRVIVIFNKSILRSEKKAQHCLDHAVFTALARLPASDLSQAPCLQFVSKSVSSSTGQCRQDSRWKQCRRGQRCANSRAFSPGRRVKQKPGSQHGTMWRTWTLSRGQGAQDCQGWSQQAWWASQNVSSITTQFPHFCRFVSRNFQTKWDSLTSWCNKKKNL